MQFLIGTEKMKNKKGIFFLGPVVMKILISVIVIALLVGLMASLVGIVTERSKAEQARATLDDIVSNIEDIDDGEERIHLVQSVDGWQLLAYDFNSSNPSPKYCFDSNCICICKTYGSILEGDYLTQEQANLCQSEGFCVNDRTNEFLVDYIPSVLLENQIIYNGRDCFWKGTNELAIAKGRQGVLHFAGTDDEVFNEIHIVKGVSEVKISRIVDNVFDEGWEMKLGLWIHDVFYPAKVEVDPETGDCFIRDSSS